MFIFTVKGTKIVNGKELVYDEVKKLILNEDDGKIDITIEPSSDKSAKRIMSLFSAYLRTAKWEPAECDLSPFTYQMSGKNILINGDKGSLERAINALTYNSFISPETSRQIKYQLATLTVPTLNPPDERTPLIKKPSR